MMNEYQKVHSHMHSFLRYASHSITVSLFCKVTSCHCLVSVVDSAISCKAVGTAKQFTFCGHSLWKIYVSIIMLLLFTTVHQKATPNVSVSTSSIRMDLDVLVVALASRQDTTDTEHK